MFGLKTFPTGPINPTVVPARASVQPRSRYFPSGAHRLAAGGYGGGHFTAGAAAGPAWHQVRRANLPIQHFPLNRVVLHNGVYYVKQRASRGMNRVLRWGLGAGAFGNPDGTFTCSDGSIVDDPSQCPPDSSGGGGIAPGGTTDNGDGTFTCPDGTVVTDPTQCGGAAPPPGDTSGGGGDTTGVITNPGGTTVADQGGTPVSTNGGGGGGGGGGGSGGGGTTPTTTTTSSGTNYTVPILIGAGVVAAGIVGWAVFSKPKHAAHRRAA